MACWLAMVTYPPSRRRTRRDRQRCSSASSTLAPRRSGWEVRPTSDRPRLRTSARHSSRSAKVWPRSGQFSHLYGLSDADLAAEGAKRCVVDSKPGFPDRVEVREMNIGQHAILLNYEHQPADTPYRSRHAIFVREGAHRALDAIDVIPDVLCIRPISLRGFSENGEMVDADLVDGDALAPLIERFFKNPAITCLQAHYAKRGCYAARIVRADLPI